MNLKKNRKTIVGLSALFLGFITITGCFNLTKHIKKLDPEEKTFFFDVQPLLTIQERNIYFSLDKNERKQFEKRFWEIRNPEPNSEENIFKQEYYQRVAIAKKAFWTDGTGLMGDRSRVFLLLGSPDVSRDYPVVQSSEFRALQKWVYSSRGLVIYFADRMGIGKYELYNPPGQLLLYLNQAQTNFFGIEKGKKWINFELSNSKEGLVVLVNTSSIEYKEVEDAMNYGLTVKISGMKRVIFQKEYAGKFDKSDSVKLKNFLDLLVPYQEGIQKENYFYLTVYDNIGKSIGGQMIHWKDFNK